MTLENEVRVAPCDYLKARVENQIAFHNKTANRLKLIFVLLVGLQVVLSALIPLLSLIDTNVFSNFVISKEYAVAICGSVLGIISAIQGFSNLQTHWLRHRMLEQKLISEKNVYLTRTRKYATDDEQVNFRVFVDSIESLLQEENQQWSEVLKNRKVNADKEFK